MLQPSIRKFHDAFQLVDDPRVSGRCDHPLHSVLFLVVAAVISNADGPAEIEQFGREREDWLSRFVDFPNGIPSHDTIGRILSLIKPIEFQQALIEWINQLRSDKTPNDPLLVQIDGKTARGSYTTKEKNDALHIVNAWASEHGLAMGQVAVDSKSNEITAIPKLLELLDLQETIITIDAIGCQKSIAQQITEGGGDYIFAVKDNHPKLSDAIEEYFIEAHERGLSTAKVRSKTVRGKTRGREEERFYAVASIPESMKALASEWPGTRSIGQAITSFVVDGEETSEVRYFISSREARVNEFAKSVRSHWSIESMHWVLDVVFHEDASRIRSGNATENMSFTRKFVTTLLKQDTSRVSLKGKRKKAGWNTEFLEKLLFGTTF